MTKKTKPGVKRRGLLVSGASAAMAGGLIGGYGACGAIGARYLYPVDSKRVRMFVADLASVAVGVSFAYELPNGRKLSVTRQGEKGDASDFIALSSTCPHLGCQVHWQASEKRYFCPCHNGTFDPNGKPTGGPPKAENTPLMRYALAVEDGLLFIELAREELA